MEISIILDGELVRNYDFCRKPVVSENCLADGSIAFSRDDGRKLDRWVRKVRVSNPRLYSSLVFVVACLGRCSVAYADVSDVTSRLNAGGMRIYDIFLGLSFWVCLYCCVADLVKSFFHEGNKDIWKIFFKYITMYILFRSLPTVFKFIDELFY